MQQVGETSKAIVEDDERLIESILNANSKRDLYWIVIFAKTSKAQVSSRPTLVRHIKPYNKKPPSMVGMIVGEVNNRSGTITWEVNQPDIPFGYESLGLRQDGVQTYQTKIPGAYLHN